MKLKSIFLLSPKVSYAPFLGWPPETVGMNSGREVLLPGESVGMQSTEDHEEVIVPLSVTDELHVPRVGISQVHPACVLYNLPYRLHEVTSTGDQPLCYIYIVARAQQP